MTKYSPIFTSAFQLSYIIFLTGSTLKHYLFVLYVLYCIYSVQDSITYNVNVTIAELADSWKLAECLKTQT